VTTIAGQVQEGAILATKKPAQDMPIRDWMDLFRRIYEDVDSKRTPAQMWVAATAHFTSMGEAIRCMNFTDLMKSAAHAFCWMCSFLLACQREKETVFSLDESFSDAVASKYPRCCGHCLKSPCRCKPKDMDKKANKAARYGKLLTKRVKLRNRLDAYSVSSWADEFDEIFGQHVHMLTLESIGFHFLEEAGEELRAIRELMQLRTVVRAGKQGIGDQFLGELATFPGAVEHYKRHWKQKVDMKSEAPADIMFRLAHAKVDMFVEFGDTFSWFCSILNKVRLIAENCKQESCGFTQQPFEETLRREYLPHGKPRCPSCEACPCVCVFYN
jgi:hypothetical protein